MRRATLEALPEFLRAPAGEDAVSTKTNVGFARLFFGDAAIVFLLLNDARHRTVTRGFGTSRGDSNVVTGLALGSAAVAVHGAAARLRTIPRHPSAANSAL